MFNWFKRGQQRSKESEVLQQNEDYAFKWYDIGKGNPFNKRILDIRSFTHSKIATTSKKEIAEKYNTLRTSTGEEHIGITIPNSKTIHSNLSYPHNGESLRGVAFKADSMDCKWDIYVYDNYFYFTRSWTGELVYKAFYQISSNAIHIQQIEHSDSISSGEAINNVHFLIMSHAMGKPFPHSIPESIFDEKQIAIYSFSQFGNRACYATYEDIFDTTVNTL
jgi:hypothetical protein